MIGDNIRKARQRRGLSQAELASRLHVVRQTVSKWENGRSAPDAELLIPLAELLGTPVSELLGLPAETEKETSAALQAQLADALAREERRKRADTLRNRMLFWVLAGVLLARSLPLPVLSIFGMGGCLFAALILLWRNLPLLTDPLPDAGGMRALRQTTLFSGLVLLLVLGWALLDGRGDILPDGGERGLVMALILLLMLFGGHIAPKLPYNRYTGLRLPWTVRDENCWRVAHRVLGMISLPMAAGYLAAALLLPAWFGPLSLAAIFLWIGIPGGISLGYFWKTYRRKG